MVGQPRADCDLGALLITKYRRPSLRWDPHSVMVVGWWVASPTPIWFVGKARPSSCLDFVEWARRETFRSDFHLKSLQSMSSHNSAMLDLQSCTFLCTLSTRYKYTGCLHPRRLLQQGTFSRSFVVQGEDNDTTQDLKCTLEFCYQTHYINCIGHPKIQYSSVNRSIFLHTKPTYRGDTRDW